MNLLRKLFGGERATQSSLPVIDFNSTNPVNILLALDPKKDRRSQMAALIEATKGIAALELPGFAHLPEPTPSKIGDYVVSATIYDKKGGIPLAYVDLLDEYRGMVYITLKGDSRRHIRDLQDRLKELGIRQPEVLY